MSEEKSVKEVVFFGVTESFNCRPSLYRDQFIERFYVDALTRPPKILVIDRAPFGWTYTFLNYRFLGVGGRSNSHFGLSIVFGNSLPYNPKGAWLLLNSFFEFLETTGKIFVCLENSIASEARFYQYKISAFEQLDTAWISNISEQLKNQFISLNVSFSLTDGSLETNVKNKRMQTLSIDEKLSTSVASLLEYGAVAFAEDFNCLADTLDQQATEIATLRNENAVQLEKIKKLGTLVKYREEELMAKEGLIARQREMMQNKNLLNTQAITSYAPPTTGTAHRAIEDSQRHSRVTSANVQKKKLSVSGSVEEGSTRSRSIGKSDTPQYQKHLQDAPLSDSRPPTPAERGYRKNQVADTSMVNEQSFKYRGENQSSDAAQIPAKNRTRGSTVPGADEDFGLFHQGFDDDRLHQQHSTRVGEHSHYFVASVVMPVVALLVICITLAIFIFK